MEISGGRRVYGLSFCSAVVIQTLAVRHNAEGALVLRYLQTARPDSIWPLEARATGADHAASVVVDDRASRRGYVISRVIVDGVDDPRLFLLATGKRAGAAGSESTCRTSATHHCPRPLRWQPKPATLDGWCARQGDLRHLRGQPTWLAETCTRCLTWRAASAISAGVGRGALPTSGRFSPSAHRRPFSPVAITNSRGLRTPSSTNRVARSPRDWSGRRLSRW